jgi:hypothetical protein
MRFALLVTLALVLTACGASMRAVRPTQPTPAIGREGPPPAWIETRSGSRWLGYSSYCWRHSEGSTTAGMCADSAPAKCGAAGVPWIPLRARQEVRAHLGYTPNEVSVEHAAATLHGRVVEWRIAQAGPFLLFTKGEGVDASYVGCAVFGPVPHASKCSQQSGAGSQAARRRCGALP